MDLIDDGGQCRSNIVSLENGLDNGIANVSGSEYFDRDAHRILYDNVEIEDISSDEELNKL